MSGRGCLAGFILPPRANLGECACETRDGQGVVCGNKQYPQGIGAAFSENFEERVEELGFLKYAFSLLKCRGPSEFRKSGALRTISQIPVIPSIYRLSCGFGTLKLMKNIESIRDAALAEIENAKNADALERIRVVYLGRQGRLTALLRSLKDLPLEERRKTGSQAQALKRDLERLLSEKLKSYKLKAASSRMDLTAPPKRIMRGHLHPLTLAEQDVRKIFLGMNFSVIDGPEVETEYYNFDALNIPPDHPAREMHDTFWLRQPESREKDPRRHLLLRTHISSLQARYLERHAPPFQFIAPGRVFRYEASDASHDVQFQYMEGMMVGADVTLANFKFVAEEFLARFFKGHVEFRYRPSYFPFVEPGLEVDIKLKNQRPKRKADSWLEIMGAGMVHPRVFEYAHHNPRDWQGFAFGVGLDRLAMIRHKIPDIRLFYSGDLRFINQF